MTRRAELYRLQEIDVTWDRVRRRLLQIQKLLSESEELRTIRKRVAELETALHNWQGQQKESELQARTLAAKIDSTEKLLMSGEVRNPKELTSLQSNVEALRRQHSSVEERGVEALLMVEQLSEQLKRQKAHLDQMEQEWQSSQTTLTEEGRQRKRELIYLKQQREAQVKSMDPTLLAQYNQLRKRKHGVAVARLNGDTCDACHMQVPTGVISTVRSVNDELATCPSCGRILYAD